jgi:hypothetical protein
LKLLFYIEKGVFFTFHFADFLFQPSVFFEEAPGVAPFVGEETSEDKKADGEETGENRQGNINLLAI